MCYFKFSASSKNLSDTQSRLQLATTPPRGWNSYDCFCWIISEQEFLHSAQIVSQRLRNHGYEVCIGEIEYVSTILGGYRYDIFASNTCSMLWWIISGIEGKFRVLIMILLVLTSLMNGGG